MSLHTRAWRDYLAGLRATSPETVEHHIGTALAALSSFASEEAVVAFLSDLADDDRGTPAYPVVAAGFRALHTIEVSA